jgi:hypothetical protein
LPGTNALAYFEKALLTAVKRFITLATGKTFTGFKPVLQKSFIWMISGVAVLMEDCSTLEEYTKFGRIPKNAYSLAGSSIFVRHLGLIHWFFTGVINSVP